MKKLICLMALIICLGCALLTACNGDDVVVDTGDNAETTAAVTEADDTKTPEESETKAPGSSNTTKPSDDTDNGSSGDVSNNEINESNDAYADDIYSGVAPGVIG